MLWELSYKMKNINWHPDERFQIIRIFSKRCTLSIASRSKTREKSGPGSQFRFCEGRDLWPQSRLYDRWTENFLWSAGYLCPCICFISWNLRLDLSTVFCHIKKN